MGIEGKVALDLGWSAFELLTSRVSDEVRRDGAPAVLVGVLRGGMLPAVLMAHQLGVRDVRGVAVAHTESDAVNAAKSLHPMVISAESLGDLTGLDVLLVDDVAGSGATAAVARTLVAQRAARVRSAVMVVNTLNWEIANDAAPGEIHEYIGTTCAGWVRFPWEAK